LIQVDFGSSAFDAMPRQLETRCVVREGRVHAVLDFFIVEDEQGRQLSTNPRARRCEPWGYARDIAWGNGFQLVAEEPDGGADGSEDPELDKRWLAFPDVDVPGPGPVMTADDLRLCKCACVYYGNVGFVVADGRTQFRLGTREELMDPRNHTAAPGCTLYVAVQEDEPRLPRPFDVQDNDEIRIRTLFQKEQRSAQNFVSRIL